MRIPAFIHCVLLLQLAAAGSAAEPYYAVVISAELRSPGTAHVCHYFTGFSEKVDVSLTLILQAQNITILTMTVEDSKSLSCSPFPVPSPSASEEVGSLQVEIHGDSIHFNNSKKILVKMKEKSTFLQSDKAIYKPGQKVQFRVVTLDDNFLPDSHEYPVVELQDPNNNRIAQWVNVIPRQGIAALSYQLSSEPALGHYTIKVGKYSSTFSVEEYVLPTFEVLIKLPKVVTLLDKSFQFRVCAKYTYGKSVAGKMEASLCRMAFTYSWIAADSPPGKDRCLNLSGLVDHTGCFSAEVSTEAFNLTSMRYDMRLQAKASLEEEGTGVKLSASKSCPISSQITTITFKETRSSYKAGLPFTGTMELKNADGSPGKNKKIYLFVTYHDISENQTYVTDETGRADFTLDTSHWDARVFLKAKYTLEESQYEYGKVSPYHADGILNLEPFFSKSKSFLKIQSQEDPIPCQKEQEVVVDYIIQHKELGEDADRVTFMYLVASSRGLTLFGSKDVMVGKEDVLKGTFTFPLSISMSIAPLAKVLIYALLPEGEVVADRADFHISKCFNNEVNVKFSSQEALPGSDISLHLKAAPRSLCAVRGVDQSVILMKPEAELTVDTVYNLLPTMQFGGYSYKVDDFESYPCVAGMPPPFIPPVRGSRRKRFWIPWFQTEPDAYSLFKETTLKIISNANIKKPVSCMEEVMVASRGMPGSPGVAFAMPGVPNNILPQPAAREEQVRKYFPETWIWDLYPVSDSGTADVPLTVPDTITEWKASMFCTADIGFGLSPTATLRAFQPFFIDLKLPYSVIREETASIKGNVFNYLPNPIKVQVTLMESQEFRVEPCADCQYTSCLGANEGKTFTWLVTALKLGEVNLTVSAEALQTTELCGNEVMVVPAQGRIDTLVKPLLVQPGGLLEEKTQSFLLCGGGDKPVVETISLKIPDHILEGSAWAYVTVVGDIMGTTLQNIDQLIQLPSGCGEQNMVKLAPNIYVLEFLNKTGQVTEEIKSKTVKFLETGYQRQLNYKHDDGSYSAFGKSDPEGNTWLTAFVMKTMSRGPPYIFVPDEIIQQGVNWLKSHQMPNGCFQSVGKLFHTAMKGGVDDAISLSTYITGALLEMGRSSSDPITASALSCLKAAAGNVSSMYTQAMMAYVFTLAMEKELRQTLLEKLEKQAMKSGGQMHWEPITRPVQEKDVYWYKAPSTEVETTAYCLLAYVSNPEIPKADVGKATEIVSWLSKQRNAFGGFSSSQDTVIGLQALAEYSTVTNSATGNVRVHVQSKTGFQEEFHVDKRNRLLLQEKALPDIPGEYEVEASGQGCAYLQATLRYNVPPAKSDVTFALSVVTHPEECSSGEAAKEFEVQVTVRYVGDRVTSNMVIIQVKMLSGYIPVKSSVRELEKLVLVKKTEVTPEEVNIYLEELSGDSVPFNFKVKQDIVVKGLKPATVKVYDYYQTEDHAIAEYNAPCSSEDGGKKD
ncbi:alpha-2-macroglobulin-like protein 1 isoform X2 [Rhinatrema bivittatum]|uniref:alpha-2-macroglobulin-like protein 1 isoform X2 n=1 Tax=Rhinatrema bivittatum TaxID=194408 RepID=UPI001127A551|nr:alpha-2-macroglobulin-like protein 1 isoform X2 [Rhinatrema bivittatum]